MILQSTKLLLATLVVFLLNNVSAACLCSEPGSPSIPSGYYAEEYEMEAARYEVEQYLNDIKDYKQCLIRCVDEATSEAESVIDEWNSAVSQYNNR